MRTIVTRRSLLAMAGATAGLTALVATPATAAPAASQLNLTALDAAGLRPAAPAPAPMSQAWAEDDLTIQALRNGICESGEFCVYRDSNRRGPVIDWAKGVDDRAYGNDSFPITGGGVGDEGSSVWNRTGCIVTVFRDGDFNGPWVDIAPNTARNLGGTTVGNDRASSHDAHNCP